MKLSDLEQAMREGRRGKAALGALTYRQRVGEFLDADDLFVDPTAGFVRIET